MYILVGGCLLGALVGIGAVVAADTTGVFAGQPGNADVSPKWSPDGSQIAFASNRGGSYDIYDMRADGSHVVQLTRDPFADLYPLKFWVSGTNPSPNDWTPAWSPDGRHILFVSGRDNIMLTYVSTAVYQTNADGSHVTLLTPWPGVAKSPVWSPDGRHILFESNLRKTPISIFEMSAEGSNVVQLTKDLTDTGNPAWSPDGSRIVFASQKSGIAQIYVMDADGSNVTQLTRIPLRGQVEPSWLPDGKQIAFVSGRDSQADIYLMDADGSNLRPLTQNAGANTEPAWSPDSSRIAFVSDRDGDLNIYVMNADGSKVIQRTK